MNIRDLATKVVGDKRRWREYKRRAAALPPAYGTAIAAFERYLMHLGPADGDSAAQMFDDLADLFEQAAAEQTPLVEVIGDDPVEFIETFMLNYAGGGWVGRERSRLADGITSARDLEVAP